LQQPPARQTAPQPRQITPGTQRALQLAAERRASPPPAPPAQPGLTQAERQRQIDEITRQIENVRGQLETARGQLDIIHRARDVGMPITPQTTVTEAQQFLDARAAPVAPIKIPKQQIQDRMAEFLAQQEAILRERPAEQGLTPEERQLFVDRETQLRAQYSAALDALRRQQAKERERLIGRYAVAGFTEPGIIAGPMAGEPGIVTRALGEIGERQRREIAELEQAQAGNLLEMTAAMQEADRRARAEEVERFERRQQAMMRNLEQQLGLVRPEQFTLGGRIFERSPLTGEVRDVTPATAIQPERFTVGGRIFERNPATGETRDITPPEALIRDEVIERGGRRVRVFYDANRREIGSIDLGPVKQARIDEPASFREWRLAGGLEGTGMTYKQWLEWREQIQRAPRQEEQGQEEFPPYVTH
jgi:hypothetical protein